MDNAYDCGGSLIGKAAAARYFEDWAQSASLAQRGGPGRKPFFAVADETKGYLAELLGGVEPKNIAITKNTNEGISSVVMGFGYTPGDNIVTMDMEYPSVVMPCLNAAKLHGIDVKFARLGPDKRIPVDLIWEQVDERTVMVLVSHVQSSTGYKIDIKELARRCNSRGIFLVVDAIQSLGLNECNAHDWGISAIASAGYKGLGASISTGFVYCCDELLKRIWPVYVSHNFGLVYDKTVFPPQMTCLDEASASKLQNDSIDFLGVYVLHGSLQRISEIGIDRISAHINTLFEKLYAGLEALGYQIITPLNPENRCASITIETAHAAEIAAFFLEQGVVITGNKSIIRISLGAYNNMADVEKTLQTAALCHLR